MCCFIASLAIEQNPVAEIFGLASVCFLSLHSLDYSWTCRLLNSFLFLTTLSKVGQQLGKPKLPKADAML